jgi:exosortase
LWLLFVEWPAARPKMKAPSGLSVALMFVPLLALYFVATVAQIAEVEGYILYALLIVVLYSFIGFGGLRALWFPLLYIAFSFPPPQTVIDLMTSPLKMWVSQMAVSALYALGYPIAGAGVVIQMGQYQLLVAAACSGLNSLISLAAITMFYVYIRHKANALYMVTLFLLAVPIALFANFVRVIILVLLTYYFGEAAAQGFLHEFAGIAMFATALASTFALDMLLVHAIGRFTARSGKGAAAAEGRQSP